MTPYKKELADLLPILTESQTRIALNLAKALAHPYERISRNKNSDIVTDQFLNNFGDYLRVHHCFSKHPFTKDKFEYAMESICTQLRINTELAPAGNPGYDIKISGINFSLKTQADRNIKSDLIHISKFMELGKGKWSDDAKDLLGLRDQFFEHMKSYERILTLRCLSQKNDTYLYELVEIPKTILLEARSGSFRMMHDSTQMPKPGYCDVSNSNGEIRFQLYFDGGGERKLQIKNLKKDLCIVHGEWSFLVKELK